MLIRSNDFSLSTLFLTSSILLFSCFPGLTISAVVTLNSMQIHKTYEWFKISKPTVYFHCKGGNKTVLPDVKEVNVTYSFNGDESWQPLTEFRTKKCQRCGFYEEDSLKSDDVYDEWEFCPSDFTNSDGKYKRSKDDQFNATFLCKACVALATDLNDDSSSPGKGKGMHIAVIVLISTLVSTVLILGSIFAYKYWQKKRRQQEQARFLKLFEDGDDFEDDLDLDTI